MAFNTPKPIPTPHKVATYNYLKDYVNHINETNGMSYVDIEVPETGRTFTVVSLFGDNSDEITIVNDTTTISQTITGSSYTITIGQGTSATVAVSENVRITVKHEGTTYYELQATLLSQRAAAQPTVRKRYTKLPLRPSTSEDSDTFSCSQCVSEFDVLSITDSTTYKCVVYNTQDCFQIRTVDTDDVVYPSTGGTISGISTHITERINPLDRTSIITVSASTNNGDSDTFTLTTTYDAAEPIVYGWRAFYPRVMPGSTPTEEEMAVAIDFCEECAESGGDEEKNNKICIKQSNIVKSTFTSYGTASTRGIIINGYSVGNGESTYAENQLVLEQDLDYNTISYDLIVKAITVEIDAMVDSTEYMQGFLPNYASSSNFEMIPYAEVYNVTGGSEERIYSFSTTSSISRNGNTTRKDYTNQQISKSGFVAKVQKNTSLTINYFNDDKTLTSTTLQFNGSLVTTSITTSQNADSKVVTVKIDKDGFLTFGIAQWKETYGYFVPEVYTQNSTKFAVIENNSTENGLFAGNVRESAVAENFITAHSIDNSSYETIRTSSIGWLDDAGDNFGTNAIDNKGITVGGASIYSPILQEENVNQDLCGQDVYNSNATVYYRGQSVGSTYHMAYANDVYSSSANGGFDGTLHLYTTEGYLSGSVPSYSCTSSYPLYTHDPFLSDYRYKVVYRRTYRKEMHSYGLTSILRRFRLIGSNIQDTSGSFGSSGINAANGNTYPANIKKYELTWSRESLFSDVNYIRAGANSVTGWTTVYEATGETIAMSTVSSAPTVRNVNAVLTPEAGSGVYGVSADTNTKTTVKYLNIGPRFYMVDAERCYYPNGTIDGFNYTFFTNKSIVDMTNTEGTSSTGDERDFYLDYNVYIKNAALNPSGTWVSIQDAYRTNVSFIDTDLSNTNRYATTVSYVTCAPHAPLETIRWIDTYAPNSSSGGTLTSAPVLYQNEFPSVTTETNRVVPMINSWGSFTNSTITLNDINYPSSYTDTSTNRMYFAGDNDYTFSHNNASSHSLLNSTINFALDNEYTTDMGSKLGAVIPSTSPTYSAPQHAVVLKVEDDETKIASYKYYGLRSNVYTASTSSSNDNQYKFVDVQSKYQNGVYLRPCFGDVTLPIWNGQFKYVYNNVSGTDMSNAGIRVKVNDYVVSSTEGTMINGVKCVLVNQGSTHIEFPWSTDGQNTASPAIYIMPIVEADNVSEGYTNKFNKYITLNTGKRTVTLGLIVFNYYQDFTLSVEMLNHYNDTTATHSITWKVYGRNNYHIDVKDICYTLDSNNWKNYSTNSNTVLMATSGEINSKKPIKTIYDGGVFSTLLAKTYDAREDDNSEKTHNYWW